MSTIPWNTSLAFQSVTNRSTGSSLCLGSDSSILSTIPSNPSLVLSSGTGFHTGSSLRIESDLPSGTAVPTRAASAGLNAYTSLALPSGTGSRTNLSLRNGSELRTGTAVLTRAASAGLNVSMCGIVETPCSCEQLFNERAKTYVTTVTGTRTNTGQYPYQEYRSTNPTTETFIKTLTTSVITESAYMPPDDCCNACMIDAEEVRILYWPVETGGSNTMAASNTSMNAGPTPAGFVSDGVTL